MSDSNRPVIIRSEDWYGLYIGGTLYIESHNKITVEDVLNALNIHYNVYNIDQEYMEDMGELPINFYDLDANKIREV